jgi:hypothetical protein
VPTHDEIEHAAHLTGAPVDDGTADERGRGDECVRDDTVGEDTLRAVLPTATERGRGGKGRTTGHDTPPSERRVVAASK